LNKITLILIATLSCYEGKTQHTLENIIAKSRAFYKGINNGSFKVTTSFKSSIAESYHISSSDISFCKKQGISKIVFEKTEIILTKNKYYYVDQSEKKFIDFSAEKTFKKEKTESLEQYPHFNPNYFDRFKKKKFKVELSGRYFHVYDFSEHFYIDTIDFCILRYKSFIIDAMGLQVKEWNIENQKIYSECPEKLSNFSFLKNYKKVKAFGTVKENPAFNGVALRNLISVPKLYSSSGDVIVVDSLKGKYILIDFFYQSCMPCIMSFKYIKELQLTNKPGKELVIIGIDPVPFDSSSMTKFKKRYQLNYDIIVIPYAESLNSVFNPAGIYPYYILVNPKGEIIDRQEGYSEEFFKKVKNIITK
jgi:hypothetical protein